MNALKIHYDSTTSGFTKPNADACGLTYQKKEKMALLRAITISL